MKYGLRVAERKQICGHSLTDSVIKRSMCVAWFTGRGSSCMHVSSFTNGFDSIFVIARIIMKGSRLNKTRAAQDQTNAIQCASMGPRQNEHIEGTPRMAKQKRDRIFQKHLNQFGNCPSILKPLAYYNASGNTPCTSRATYKLSSESRPKVVLQLPAKNATSTRAPSARRRDFPQRALLQISCGVVEPSPSLTKCKQGRVRSFARRSETGLSASGSLSNVT